MNLVATSVLAAPLSTLPTPAQEEDIAHELLHEVLAVVQEETGMNQQFAEPLAKSIVHGLRRRMGTANVYIPSLAPGERDRRDRDMRAMYHEQITQNKHGSARALEHVAREFKVTQRTARNICCPPPSYKR